MKITTTAITLSCFVILCISCQSQNNKEKVKINSDGFNTNIIINFKNNSDRRLTNLSQLNPLYFENYWVTPPPNITDTSDKLKTSIRIKLSQPTYLALGFNVFYIEPGDSLNLDYEVKYYTRFKFKDTAIINHGNVFFIWEESRSPLVFKYQRAILDSIRNSTEAKQINQFLSGEHFNSMVNIFTNLVYKDFSNLKNDDSYFEKVKISSISRLYYYTTLELKHLYLKTKNKELKDAIKNNVTILLENACQQKETNFDPMTWSKYLSLYRFFKEVDASQNSILKKFENCNDTIKQYVLLNLFKDGLTSDTSKSGTEKLMSQFTYPPIKEEALKINQVALRGIEKSGYINNLLRNIEIFDTNDKKLLFGDLFSKTAQPFILFDFCGSWCKPCLEEINVYSKMKHLDNSKKLKPIWLFFENDKSKWMPIVEQYGIKKENCFVITSKSSKDLEKEFALLFDWGGEFPHHFLFTKEGKIAIKNVHNFSNFEEDDLPKLEAPKAPALPPAAKKNVSKN